MENQLKEYIRTLIETSSEEMNNMEKIIYLRTFIEVSKEILKEELELD